MERGGFGINFIRDKLFDLGFADDIALIVGDKRELPRCTEYLIEVMSKTGLHLNTGKWEVVTLDYENIPVIIGEEQVKEVQNFKYLDSVVSQDGSATEDISLEM